MKRCILTIACLCLLPGTVLGQCAGGACPVGTPPHPAVARIANRNRAGQYLGSGTLVDKDDARGIVVTCAHLFRDGVGQISVAFAGGKTFGANLVAIDRQWDLAALEIAPPAAPPVEIAAAAPRPGDWLESCGFGPGGRVERRRLRPGCPRSDPTRRGRAVRGVQNTGNL
jgi:S1-C subfamily serine protease